MDVILTINPGSTSTKIGFFSKNEKLLEENITFIHNEKSESIADELPYRLKDVEKMLGNCKYRDDIVAVVGRGGPLKPLPGGVYRINEKMLNDFKTAKYSSHASNLGAMLANQIAEELTIPSFIIDPVTVDDFDPLARISGVPGIKRKSRSHALNIRATARKICDKNGWDFTNSQFVVAHLGGGISVAALKNGKIRDVNDGLLGMGPFSPERAGALPIGAVVELTEEHGKKECEKIFSKNAGLKAYLGTADAREVEKRIEGGDEEAELIYNAMIYQIRKEIGAMLAACDYDVHAVIVTGGLAHSDYIKNKLQESIKSYKLIFWPGENELEAMADGGFRALEGKIIIGEYT
ncbi:MAG: butyrate kinase [Candidatus Marinimicrobia bacterium]|nr:butyrate kinase [Candidatus Neomarinimicrobiota bacterium]